MIKLRSLIGAALAAWLVAPAAVMAQKQLHIIVVTHGAASDSFWAPVKNGADEAGKETGSLVEYRAPEKFDMVAMSQLIEATVAAKPDGLVVTIPDADALAAPIKAALSSKIPVISTNSGWDVSKKLGVILHVGQEEFTAGKGAGERMKAMGVKKAVVVNHLVGNVALDLRAKGFIEGLGQNAEVLATKLDFTEGRNAISAYLQKNPDLEAIMTLGPNGAEPAIQALESAGKLGKLKFGTFDLSPTILEDCGQRPDGFLHRPTTVPAGLPTGRVPGELYQVRHHTLARYRVYRAEFRYTGNRGAGIGAEQTRTPVVQ